jgi:hypothetical protein
MSTKITLERLATFSKQFKANYTLSITDLSINPIPENGTKVEMTLPVININEEQEIL